MESKFMDVEPIVFASNRSASTLLGSINPRTLPKHSNEIALTSLLVFIAWAAYKILYNLYFHPLSAFPGPILARSSLAWRFVNSMSGNMPFAVDEQHKKSGDVFRVSPNELSFASNASWKAIYGKHSFLKSEFFAMINVGFKSHCISSELDPVRFAGMKKLISPAFSSRALREQEVIVSQVIDRFVKRVGEESRRHAETGIDAAKWFEIVTFDIVSEMAFGKSFGCIESAKRHSWAELILTRVYLISLADNLRRVPLIRTLAKTLFPTSLVVLNENSQYSRRQVEERLKQKTNRQDFMSKLVDKVESGQVSKEEMAAHISTLVMAGGETSSTCLTSVSYHLTHYPESYSKLQEELRNRFARYEDINATACEQLPYLQAVINEALRLYPPGPQGFPRISPGAYVGEYWVPKGTEVYTSGWTVMHDERYFHDPYNFKPERWIDPDCKDVKEASQPFSLGARGCLGRNFAEMEMRLILAKLLWKYDMKCIDMGQDLIRDSQSHYMWWKPEVLVKFTARPLGTTGTTMSSSSPPEH